MHKVVKKIMVIAVLATIGGTIGYHYTNTPGFQTVQQGDGAIVDYDGMRDKDNILQMFVDNRWWLLSSDDYDVDLMLTHKAPNENPLYFGKLIIKVLGEDNTFVGFTVYYKETITRARLLFLAVKQELRGKGYATRLAQYALDDLKSMGAKKVVLVTRVQNLPAQATYKKLGFREVKRDQEYVDYERLLS